MFGSGTYTIVSGLGGVVLHIVGVSVARGDFDLRRGFGPLHLCIEYANFYETEPCYNKELKPYLQHIYERTKDAVVDMSVLKPYLDLQLSSS